MPCPGNRPPALPQLSMTGAVPGARCEADAELQAGTLFYKSKQRVTDPWGEVVKVLRAAALGINVESTQPFVANGCFRLGRVRTETLRCVQGSLTTK